jgi:arabinogalactan oligomer/maltooligosaccharide transport system permease protein
MFNIIFLVSEGEPGGATEILISEAYKIAFQQYRYGYAAAYSVVIFFILFAYGTFQNRATRATEAVA